MMLHCGVYTALARPVEASFVHSVINV